MAELLAALDEHRRWSDGSGERERRRVRAAEAEIEAVAVTRLRARIRDAHGASLPDLAKRWWRASWTPTPRPTSWNPAWSIPG